MLPADRDPVAKIHKAGWHRFNYNIDERNHRGQPIRVQLTDLFGASLYLCTIPQERDAVREEIYNQVCETLDVPEDSYYLELLEQAGCDLEVLFAKLKGAYSFPEDPLVRLSDNKTLQFPLKLFEHPYYRALYERVKQDFLDVAPTGDRHLKLVAYPIAEDKKIWKCIKEDCDGTFTSPLQMATHLSEKHHEHDGCEAHLATITFQTKTRVTKVRSTTFIIHKSAKHPRVTAALGKPAKRAKPESQLHARLESAFQDIEDKNDRLMTTLDQMTKTQAQNADTMAKQADTQAKLVNLISTNMSIQGASRNSQSLESALENFRKYQAFLQMQPGPAGSP